MTTESAVTVLFTDSVEYSQGASQTIAFLKRDLFKVLNLRLNKPAESEDLDQQPIDVSITTANSATGGQIDLSH